MNKPKKCAMLVALSLVLLLSACGLKAGSQLEAVNAPRGTVVAYFQALDDYKTEYTYYNKNGKVLDVVVVEVNEDTRYFIDSLKLALNSQDASEVPADSNISITKLDQNGNEIEKAAGWIGSTENVEKVQEKLAQAQQR